MTKEEAIIEKRVLEIMTEFKPGFEQFKDRFPEGTSIEDVRFEWTKFKIASLAYFAEQIVKVFNSQYGIKP